MASFKISETWLLLEGVDWEIFSIFHCKITPVYQKKERSQLYLTKCVIPQWWPPSSPSPPLPMTCLNTRGMYIYTVDLSFRTVTSRIALHYILSYFGLESYHMHWILYYILRWLLVRQSQIVQSVMQDRQNVLSHLLPVTWLCNLLVQGSKITYCLSRRF